MPFWMRPFSTLLMLLLIWADGLHLSSASPIMTGNLPPSSGLSAFRFADLILDPGDRVGEEFKVPRALVDRTRFWFDIYTRYTSAHHVIHHTRYPWIVYAVVDTSDLLAGKGALWYRRQKAEDTARRKRIEIQTALRALARNPARIDSALKESLAKQLEVIPGPRRKVYAAAARLTRTQLGQRDFMATGVRQSRMYLHYMQEIFAAQGLPRELTRMPFVESSFNPRAQSKVGASGIWQIMPSTGSAYSRVDQHIDERNSPIKATHLAAKLLKQYRRALGSWPLAITAYNHGIGNIRTAIRRAGSTDLPTIIERYHGGDFQFASANFYASFLAALHAETYHDIIFPDLPKDALMIREVVRLKKPLSLRQIMRATGVDRKTLMSFNLDIRSKHSNSMILPRGFELHLPVGSGAKLNPQVVEVHIPTRKVVSRG